MSSRMMKENKLDGFVQRFAECCGTDEPARVGRLLKISYQAAKNYLAGRLPEPRVLIRISEVTGVSIHWLLTGTGDKFARVSANFDTPLSTHQIRQMIREEAGDVLNEMLLNRSLPDGSRIVALSPGKISFEAPRNSESADAVERPDLESRAPRD